MARGRPSSPWSRAAAAALVLLACCWPVAVVGQCPAETCQAAYEVLSGPVDCCTHDYSKGKCAWAGTPVSWTRVRICNQEGSNYAVLTRSNFQGPPGGSPECRCSSPMRTQASFPSVLQACVSLKSRQNTDIVGNDIPCQSNDFCQISGGLDRVKEACMANNRCVAFSFEPSTGIGYLKSAPYTSSRPGWVSYTRD